MELLKQLYCIHSPFYREWPMICFIREYIRQHVPKADVQMDSWGNLYIQKGEGAGYPILACHLDQVQELHSDDLRQITSPLYLLPNSRSNGPMTSIIQAIIVFCQRMVILENPNCPQKRKLINPQKITIQRILPLREKHGKKRR